MPFCRDAEKRWTRRGNYGKLSALSATGRGAAIGTCSHAIGATKALELGEMEGAVSSLAIAVAGVLTAVLCPIFAAGLG